MSLTSISKRAAKISISVCLAIIIGALLFDVAFRIYKESGSSTSGQSNDDPRAGETLNVYRQRMVQEAGATPGAAPSTLYVLAYVYLDGGKCVSVNPGVLSIESGHTMLTYYSFAEDRSRTVYAVRPYLKRSSSDFKLPDFEVPPPFLLNPTTDPNHLLTYGPNASLVTGAEQEGLKQVNPNFVSQLSSDHLLGPSYNSRWRLVNSFTAYQLDDQLIMPINGAGDGACLSHYYDGRSLWKEYVYPGARILEIDAVHLTLSTSASADDVAAFYRRLPKVNVWDVNGQMTHMSQGVGTVDVSIRESNRDGGNRTVMKLNGQMDENYISEHDQDQDQHPLTDH